MVNNLEGNNINHSKIVEAIKGSESKSNSPLNLPSSLGGSALGLYQVVSDTRKQVYDTYFKNNMTKTEFDNLYLKDADFQKTVASKVSEMYYPKSQEQSQKYGVPVELASVLNYFLGTGGGDVYLKYYTGSNYNHTYAQQKYDDWYLDKYGKSNPNTKIRDYVTASLNRYYQK